MKTVIFDLDGILADIVHRRHFVSNNENNWSEFNDRMSEDVINEAKAGFYL